MQREKYKPTHSDLKRKDNNMQFSIDTTAVRQKAAMLNNIAEDYDGLRRRLLETANATSAVYQSADNRAFVEKITELCTQMNEVSNRLRNAAQVMTNQSSDYDRTEEENTGAARRL